MPALLRTQLTLSNCPLCGINSPNLGYVWESRSQDYQAIPQNWAVYRCNKCAGLVTAKAEDINYEIYFYHPRSGNPLSADLPQRVQEYLQQAMASGESPVGALILAASAVDSMLQDKGYTTGTLFDKINEAMTARLITQDMANWAHNLRLDANDQRHFDLNSPLPSSDDAQRSIDFALALGEILFVLPARVTRGITS